jgi:hypothetical protein
LCKLVGHQWNEGQRLCMGCNLWPTNCQPEHQDSYKGWLWSSCKSMFVLISLERSNYIHKQTSHRQCKIWARQDSEWISTLVKTIVQTILYYSFHKFLGGVEWSGQTIECLHTWETGWEWSNLLTLQAVLVPVLVGLGSWQMVFSSVLGGKEISKRRFGKQVRGEVRWGEVRWEVRGERWGGVSQSAVPSDNNIPD